ncbi:YidC/Oxa1 family membrane protein insertase, partial [Klebsiella pneumoniae]|nr:YidC/Oxa1 family membrane protein insertase [Klebsiella pneumoniae]
MKKSTMMQERMAMLQPQMRALQERQKQAKTPEEQAAASQAMMSFYKDNNVSLTGGIGCLPLLIQLPVFSALYFAIR